MRYITQILADFACDTQFQNLDSTVVTAVRRLVLDTLASAVGGVQTENAVQMRVASNSIFGSGDYMA